MSDIAIRCQGLSKRYVIGERERYYTLRDKITRLVRSPLKSLHGLKAFSNREENSFWALKDLNFEIRTGDVVGIIGRNGAGKSTLLKLLSRITKPTHGRADIFGRLASLLEVGTGFHPELTGRENIFLNGAILGMRKAEIIRKFDQIVSFAEVEKFLDTPVKHYSSGMYVRLAFAVAAHLEQEILLIDEVLAVGDAEFQKKCLGKMEEISKKGRTVLFVSHNSSAIANLCNRGIILEKGSVRADTTTLEALNIYHQELNRATFVRDGKSDKPTITQINMDQTALQRGELILKIHFTSPFELNPPIVGIVFYTLQGMPLFGTNATIHPQGFNATSLQNGTATLRIAELPLHSGSYKLSVWLGNGKMDFDNIVDALVFDYISPNYIANMPSPEVIGPFSVRGEWHLADNGAKNG